MRNHDLLHTIAFGLLPFLWTTTAAAGQHPEIENRDFDTATTGWTLDTAYLGGISWSTADASGSPHSGSARLESAAGGEVVVMGEPCITVEAGESYVLSGSVWVDEAAPDDHVRFGFADFEDPACSGTMGFGFLFSNFADAELETGRWQELAAGTHRWNETHWMRPTLWIDSDGGSVTAHFDRLQLRSGNCIPGPTTLCLNDGRFAVTADWRAVDGSSGQGRAVPFAADSGSFWFFSETNLELDVKVLDGCPFNGHYWVFAAGLTDVEVYLQVRDTETETYSTHENPLGQTFVTVTDVEAFATCP